MAAETERAGGSSEATPTVLTDGAEANTVARDVDLAALVQTAASIELAVSDWRLDETAEWEADFWQHSGHRREDMRFLVYADARAAVGTLLAPGEPLPELDVFTHGHSRRQFVLEALRNACSVIGESLQMRVAQEGNTSIIIEAPLDPRGDAIAPGAPIRISQNMEDDRCGAATVITQEDGDDYDQIALLLDEAAEAISDG